MDRTIITEEKILDLLEEITTFISKYPPENLEFKEVIIRSKGHFEVLATGWVGAKRIHTPILHVEYKDNKIKIYYDGTDLDVQNWLIEQGVPKTLFEPVHLPPNDLLLIKS